MTYSFKPPTFSAVLPQRDLMMRLGRNYPEKITLGIRLGERDTDGNETVKSVKTPMDFEFMPDQYAYRNLGTIMFSGLTGLVDRAYLYHPTAHRHQLITVPLSQPVLVTLNDTVSFDEGSIMLSAEMVQGFNLDDFDYVINEEQELTDV